jgi:hypothetical protein
MALLLIFVCGRKGCPCVFLLWCPFLHRPGIKVNVLPFTNHIYSNFVFRTEKLLQCAPKDSLHPLYKGKTPFFSTNFYVSLLYLEDDYSATQVLNTIIFKVWSPPSPGHCSLAAGNDPLVKEQKEESWKNTAGVLLKGTWPPFQRAPWQRLDTAW